MRSGRALRLRMCQGVQIPNAYVSGFSLASISRTMQGLLDFRVMPTPALDFVLRLPDALLQRRYTKMECRPAPASLPLEG
jgi:hypothetical protein